MPQVEFHILNQAGDDARLRYACALVEKAQQDGQRAFIRSSDADLRRMDELLWTFHDHAFIPHQSAQDTAAPHPRLAAVLGLDEALPAGFTTLVNLHDTLPAQLATAERIIEVVDAEPGHKQQARERYKQYRERGCTLETHNQ